MTIVLGNKGTLTHGYDTKPDARETLILAVRNNEPLPVCMEAFGLVHPNGIAAEDPELREIMLQRLQSDFGTMPPETAKAFAEAAGVPEEFSKLAVEAALDELRDGNPARALVFYKLLPEEMRAPVKEGVIQYVVECFRITDLDEVKDSMRDFGISPMELSKEPTRSQCIRAYKNALYDDYFESASEIQKITRLPDDALMDIRHGFLLESLGRKGWGGEFLMRKNLFPTLRRPPKSDQLKRSAELACRHAVRCGDLQSIKQIREYCSLSNKALKRIGWQLVGEVISRGWNDRVAHIGRTFGLQFKGGDVPSSFHKYLQPCLYTEIANGNTKSIEAIRNHFDLRKQNLDAAIPGGLLALGNETKTKEILKILNYPLNRPIGCFKDFLDDSTLNWACHFELKSLDEILDFRRTYSDYLRHLDEGQPRLTKEELALLRTPGRKTTDDLLPITPTEAEQIKVRGRYDLATLAQERNYSKLLKALIDACPVWREELGSIWTRKIGKHYLTKVFNAHRLRNFIERLGPHQALEAIYASKAEGEKDFRRALSKFTTVARCAELSGRSVGHILNTICHAVDEDKTKYAPWNVTAVQDTKLRDARDEFHLIMEECSFFSSSELKAQAAQYTKLHLLQELVGQFPDGAAIFESWKSLKRYAKLERVLSEPQLLRGLCALADSNPPLYHCLASLFFNRASNIQPDVLLKLWLNPQVFFDAGDPHTNHDLHNIIRPGRMCDGKITGSLDLSPQELRDALVNGTYDRLQIFTPLQIDYRIPKSGRWHDNTRSAVKDALGERSKGVAGRALQPTQLFHELRQELRKSGIDLKKYLDGTVEVPPALDTWLFDRVYNSPHGIKEEWIKVSATLHKKSDPIGILAGDDTTSCMPLGGGKGNTYLWDPGTSMFTVRMELSDGSIRTIAQSVLTREFPITDNYQLLLQQMKTDHTNIASVMSSSPNHAQPLITACDNIEPNRNFNDPYHQRLVQAVYRDFFGEYARRFGKEEGMDPTKVLIGFNSSATNGLQLIDDRYMPINAPIGYSDRRHKENHSLAVWMLSLQKPAGQFFREIKGPEVSLVGKVVDAHEGISPLTFRDMVPIAYVQSAVHQYNSHDDGIQRLKVLISTMSVNNEAKGRKNLSVKYTNAAGKVQGYLIAYEGRIDGKPVVILHDVIRVHGNKAASREMTRSFVSAFVDACLSSANAPQIMLNARTVGLKDQIEYELNQIGSKPMQRVKS